MMSTSMGPLVTPRMGPRMPSLGRGMIARQRPANAMPRMSLGMNRLAAGGSPMDSWEMIQDILDLGHGHTRFAGGGLGAFAGEIMHPAVDALRRNRQLQGAGRTIEEMRRGPSGMREGESFHSGHSWRRLPEGGETTFGTESDDAYRRALDDIHREAIRMRNERGLARGGLIQQHKRLAMGLKPFAEGGLGDAFDIANAIRAARSRSAGQGLHADPAMLDKNFGFARAMDPEGYQTAKTMSALDRMRDREPDMRERILDSGFGLPPGAMDERGGGWRDMLLDPQNAFMFAAKPAMLGLSGALYAGEAAAPEARRGWNWSRSRSDANEFWNKMPRMPAMPDAHALRNRGR